MWGGLLGLADSLLLVASKGCEETVPGILLTGELMSHIKVTILMIQSPPKGSPSNNHHIGDYNFSM